jgi:hypothetical protein
MGSARLHIRSAPAPAMIMRYMRRPSHYDRSRVKQTGQGCPFNLFHQPLWLMRGVSGPARRIS